MKIDDAKCILEKNHQFSLEGHNNYMKSLILPSDEKNIISAGDNTARIWNHQQKRQEAILRGHTSDVNSLAKHLQPYHQITSS